MAGYTCPAIPAQSLRVGFRCVLHAQMNPGRAGAASQRQPGLPSSEEGSPKETEAFSKALLPHLQRSGQGQNRSLQLAMCLLGDSATTRPASR